jgi:hypothetical protein
MTGAADHLGNERLDILAANPLGRALFPEMFDGQERPNAARFVFLDPRARDFYAEWDRIAHDVVALLRSAAGRNPYDRDAVSDAECAVVAELVVRIRDRGPEPDWHTNRRLFGPWCLFEAELVGDAGVRVLGMSPWDALYRLVANHRAELAATGVAS